MALLVGLAAPGAGGVVLPGALFRNDRQAGGISVMAGLELAALGGCVFPLSCSPTMKRMVHLTPHAWALDGFADLVSQREPLRRDGRGRGPVRLRRRPPGPGVVAAAPGHQPGLRPAAV